MFLADTLRTEPPRQLRQKKGLTITVMPYRDGCRSPLFFKDKGGAYALQLEIDPDTGLTDAQLARILIEF